MSRVPWSEPEVPKSQPPLNAPGENALEVALRNAPEPRLPWPVVSSYSMILPLPLGSRTKAKVVGPHD